MDLIVANAKCCRKCVAYHIYKVYLNNDHDFVEIDGACCGYCVGSSFRYYLGRCFNALGWYLKIITRKSMLKNCW